MSSSDLNHGHGVISSSGAEHGHDLEAQVHYKLVEKLAASERRFRGLIEQQRDVVFSCSSEGVLEYLSPVAREVLDLDPESCLGKNLGELLHEDCPQGPEGLRGFLQGGSASDLPRLCLAVGDGSPRWVELRLTNRGLNPLVGTLHDVTEIVRNEEERAELHGQLIQRNDELSAQADSVATLHRMQAMLTDISQEFMRNPSTDPGDMIVKALSRIGSFIDADRARVYYLSDDKKTWHGMYSWCAAGLKPDPKGGQGFSVDSFPWLLGALAEDRVVDVPRVSELPDEAFLEKELMKGVQSYLAVPMTFQGELHGCLAFASVTGERVWDAKLLSALELAAGILQSARVRQRIEQLKADFVSSVSHELRTPLTSILGFSRALACKPDLETATRQEFVEIINGQSLRLQSLIESLLEIAHIDSGHRDLELESLDLSEFVRTTCFPLEAGAAVGEVALDVDIQSGGDHMTQVDTKRIRSVVENLVGNAIKFSPKGGNVQVRFVTEGDFHRLVVQDDGLGIPLSDQGQIFDRFYRVAHPDHEIQGTGLGLAITKDIVDMHGGTIQLASTLGIGSTFTVSLPRRPVEA
jgi:PAS domain S-box-containing protein